MLRDGLVRVGTARARRATRRRRRRLPSRAARAICRGGGRDLSAALQSASTQAAPDARAYVGRDAPRRASASSRPPRARRRARNRRARARSRRRARSPARARTRILRGIARVGDACEQRVGFAEASRARERARAREHEFPALAPVAAARLQRGEALARRERIGDVEHAQDRRRRSRPASPRAHPRRRASSNALAAPRSVGSAAAGCPRCIAIMPRLRSTAATPNASLPSSSSVRARP